ncbi:MAG: ribosome biogenesis GTPase Der [Flavobacteriales bacterium]
MGAVVAIVGRPNVGKSTLFNRLVGGRKAIVEERSGVTRDRHYDVSEWTGKEFTVIDTGGYLSDSDDVFQKEIKQQVHTAIEQADAIIFMVDVTTGITGPDEEIADALRKSGKKVFLVANKVDNNTRRPEAAVFYTFGLGEVFSVSSTNGSGTGELLDELVASLTGEAQTAEDDLPRFAVVGRPNVGKSSLINTLTGEQRSIVTPVPGTTRDAVDTHYRAFGFDFILLDTAGIRKRGKVTDNLEFYSVMRSIKAIESCDVCILIIDVTEGITAQDLHIFRLAVDRGKGIAILANKWDLIDKDTQLAKEMEEQILSKTAPFTDVPVVFTSVMNKQRVLRGMQTALDVYTNRSTRIRTRDLNDFLLPLIEKHPPPASRGRYVKIKYITQLPTAVPSFALFCNFPDEVGENYKRYIENRLREKYTFSGVPVRIYFRKK